MKAAYGTFFTALMMIYCHDILADTAAGEFNVTWTRTHPAVVSVGDDAYQTYMTLECDHSMGMTVIGSLKDIILFNTACSSHISTIEYGIMQNLDFIYQYSTVSMDVMGSVMRDMFYAFWLGTDLELFTQNGFIVMKLRDRYDLVLLYDPETGIMRDINTVNGFCGAYCFHDQITNSAYDFFNNAKNIASDFRDWAQETAAWFMEPVYHIRWFPEFSGWDVVYNRFKYGWRIFLGAGGMLLGLENPLAWKGLGGVLGLGGGFDTLLAGLNEYAAHLNEVGSHNYKPF
jgi:hypothetical protein